MYDDLSRPPLGRIRSEHWREVRVLRTTPSTNAVVAEAARDGEAEGLVVVADHQSAGRGRLARTWEQPAGAGLAVSALLRPPGTPADWGWLPLAAGLAVCGALDEVAEVRAQVKWPNDVLLAHDGDTGSGKVAGVLCEAVAGALVVGIGLNVTTRREELPPGGTSLAEVGAATTDRALVLRALLRALHGSYALWRSGSADLRLAYLERSATVGRRVSLHLPGDRVVTGNADDVDREGRIVVDGVPHAAGDVVHLR